MSNVTPLHPRSAAEAAAPQIEGPHNVELEAAVIGSILIHPNNVNAVAGRLEPRHFAEQAHALVYQVVLEMSEAKLPITVTTLKTYIPDAEVALGMTLGQYVGRCVREEAMPLHLRDYAEMVIELYARRQLVQAGRAIAAKALDAPVGDRPDALIAEAESALLEVRQSVSERTVAHGLAAASAARTVERLHMARDGYVERRGFRTGLKRLDAVTGGIQAGDLWVVGGRPGMGKTTVGTTIARGVAQADVAAHRADPTVVRQAAQFFSFEVNEEQITARVLADMAYLRSSPFQNPITFGDILRGRATGDSELFRVEDAAKRLAEMPLAFDWSSRLTLAQIGARVRAEKARMHRSGCRLSVVVLDYLKMIQASERYRGQRAQEVAEISGGLKQLAKDEDVGVVLLCQLNRQNELRGDPRPQLSDLKESGDLEADADVVAFVYRPEYYLGSTPAYRRNEQDAIDKFNAARGKMELILAKNRAGAVTSLELFCDIGSSMIDDHDRRM